MKTAEVQGMKLSIISLVAAGCATEPDAVTEVAVYADAIGTATHLDQAHLHGELVDLDGNQLATVIITDGQRTVDLVIGGEPHPSFRLDDCFSLAYVNDSLYAAWSHHHDSQLRTHWAYGSALANGCSE
jgi:hypothetical protein